MIDERTGAGAGDVIASPLEWARDGAGSVTT